MKKITVTEDYTLKGTNVYLDVQEEARIFFYPFDCAYPVVIDNNSGVDIVLTTKNEDKIHGQDQYTLEAGRLITLTCIDDSNSNGQLWGEGTMASENSAQIKSISQEMEKLTEDIVATIDNIVAEPIATTNWTTSGGTSLSAESGVLNVEGTGATNYTEARYNSDLSVSGIFGHVLFLKITLSSNVGYGNISARIWNTERTGGQKVIGSVEPTIGNEYVLTGYAVVPDNWTGNVRLVVIGSYADGVTADGSIISVKDITLADITAPYGDNNEENVDTIAEEISTFINVSEEITTKRTTNVENYTENGFGAPVINSIIDDEWYEWLKTQFYTYGLDESIVILPAFINSILQVGGTIISRAPADQRRWGFHVFEGWSTNGEDRLTMLVDKHSDYAEIYYYLQPTDGVVSNEAYKWIRIGSDVTGEGVDFTNDQAISHVPFTFESDIILATKTPSSATDIGTAGEIAWDADYIYICVATDTWKRTPLSTW